MTSVLLCATASAQEIGAEPPASPRDLEKLRADFDAAQAAQAARQQKYDEELARLRKELDDERAARKIEREELQRAGERMFEKASFVRGRFGLSLTGFVQADAVAWRQSSEDELNPSTGEPLNQSRFSIRRARLRAELEYAWVAGALEFDGNTVNGAQARLIGAEASFKWRSPTAIPYLQLTFGLFKTPFGFEVIQSDRDRLFLERSNAERALFPGEYDLGIRLAGGWRFLRYALAVMNGDPVGERLFPGRDPNQSKDVMGRVGVDVALAKKVGLRGGVSALWGTGFHKGVAASKDTLVWRDTNEDGSVQLPEIQVIQGQTSQPSKNFQRYGVGVDLGLSLLLPRLGELFVYGELYWASNLDRALLIADPVAAGRDLRELGFYVAATLELTRYAMIGLRYDRYDPDRDANDLRAGVQVPKDNAYSTIAAAAAVQFPPYARLVLEYDHNENALGRTQTGAPTTLPDDALTLRGQVSF